MKEESGLIYGNTGNIVMRRLRLLNGGYPLLNLREVSSLILNDISIDQVVLVWPFLIKIVQPKLIQGFIELSGIRIEDVYAIKTELGNPIWELFKSFNENRSYYGVITVSNLNFNNRLEVYNLTFQSVHNNRSYCGLLCVSQVALDPLDKSKNDRIISLRTVLCKNSMTGYLACISVISSGVP